MVKRRIPGAFAFARQLILENKKMPIAEALKRMEASGFGRGTKKEVNILRVARYTLRKMGYKLPMWEELGRRPCVKGIIMLGTARAAIMQQLFKTPRATTTEILEALSGEGKKAAPSLVRGTRKIMKKWFPEIDFSIKPKPLVLSAEQQKSVPAFEKIASWAIWKGEITLPDWSYATKKEFADFVNSQIPRMIKKYDPKKTVLTTFVADQIRYLAREFTRTNLIAKLGLKRPETDLLIRIIREQSRGKSFAQIAQAEHSTESNIKSLWGSYLKFKKISGRTGKKKEQ